MYDYGYRSAKCPQCGKRYMSDCGDDFCSETCERIYEREQNEDREENENE